MYKFSNPEHPGHVAWLTSRRARFVKLLREGKRVLKLYDDERKLVIELCELIDRNSAKLKTDN